MHGQLTTDTLFATARRTDAATSHTAARRVTRSGKVREHCELILGELVTSGAPMTYRELAARLHSIEVPDVMKRLNTLEIDGLVRKSGRRPCRINGNLMTTWEAI